MILDTIQLVLDANGNLIDKVYNPIRSNSNYKHLIQVVSPALSTDAVDVTVAAYNQQVDSETMRLRLAQNENVYLKGVDVINPGKAYYSAASNYNVWEAEVMGKTISVLQRINASKVGITVTFSEKVIDEFAINKLGTFGSGTNTVVDLPTPTTETIGDYYTCNVLSYASVEANHIFAYNEGAYYDGVEWLPTREFNLRQTAPIVYVTVDPSFELIYDGVDLNQTEQIVTDLANMDGTIAYTQGLVVNKADLENGIVPLSQLPAGLNVNNTDDVPEGTNLYYTEARVSANASVASNTVHRSLINNPHVVTKDQLGLGNVDNTSDLTKPVSALQQSAIDTAVAGIVDIAPVALNTLNELAAALGDDANFSTTITNSIGVVSGDLDTVEFKLASIEDNATRDQTDAEIKVAYENNLDTNNFSDAYKTKVDSVSAGAQVNDANTTLQGNTFNGISQLVKTEIDGKLPILDGSNLTNLASSPIDSVNGKVGIVVLDTDDIAEGLVNKYYTEARVSANTDVSTNKLSIASIQTNKADVTYVDSQVAAIVDTAPATLDTLNELAAALGDDANFAATVTASLGTKLNSADVKTAYEAFPDTNAYSNAEQTKLAGIQALAEVNHTSTDGLIEGSINKYYTEARVSLNSDVVANKTHISSDGSDHSKVTANELILSTIERDYVSRDFLNGTFKEQFDGIVKTNGDITLTVERTGGGDLTMQFSDGNTILDCTPIQSILLSPGSATIPQPNYIYIPINTKILTNSITGWPTIEHIKISYVLLLDNTFIDGPLINQNWNDAHACTDGQGHLSHITKWIRTQGATYFKGINGIGTDGFINIVGANAYWKTSSGLVTQMHQHEFTAKDTSIDDNIHVLNHPTTPYLEINDLSTLTVDSENVSVNNKYMNLVFWGVANKGGTYDPIMVNLPSGSYTNVTTAINDVSNFDNVDIPREYRLESGTGFLIARITVRIASGILTVHNTMDLRGKTPGTIGGGSSGATVYDNPDTLFTIYDTDDSGRVISFDAGNITTGNTRNLIMADIDIDLADIALKANISDTDTSAEVDAKIAALVDASPATLDTLNELAAALGDDPNFATTIANSIATKETAFTKNTGFNLNLGTIVGTVSEGNHLHTGVYEPVSATITKQGNTFNGLNELVFTTVDGKLPVLDGSLLTNLPNALTSATETIAMPIVGWTLVGDFYEANVTTTNTIDANAICEAYPLVTSDIIRKAWIAQGVVSVERIDINTIKIKSNYQNSTAYNLTLIIGSDVPSEAAIGALGDLTDVGITTPAVDQFLRYNGASWVNETVVIPNISVDSVNTKTGIVVLNTDDLLEGVNKYYNTSLFTTDFASKSTTDLSEGLNLYYTEARVNANTNVVASIAHVASIINPHNVTKLQVGLPLADNTSDASKPISTATQTALNLKADTTYVDTQVASLVDTAPITLDTLNELAAALNDDPNFATTIATSIGLKVDKVTGYSLTKNDFTDALKLKLDGIEAGAGTNTVLSVNTLTGNVVLNTGHISELTNLYYTEARVTANSSVAANTAKVGITPTQTANILTNNAKVVITTQQAADIVTNNAKISYSDAAAVALNTAKVGYSDTLVSSNIDVAANTAKVGYTEVLVSANSSVVANTAKVGITTQQATDITTNNAKVSYDTAASAAVALNTAKISFDSTSSTKLAGIEAGAQVNAFVGNTKNVNASTGVVTQTINPNEFYQFTSTALTTLTITLGSETAGKMNEFMFEFKSSGTAVVLTAIAGVTWIDGTPIMEINTTYQVSILNGIGIILGV